MQDVEKLTADVGSIASTVIHRHLLAVPSVVLSGRGILTCLALPLMDFLAVWCVQGIGKAKCVTERKREMQRENRTESMYCISEPVT